MTGHTDYDGLVSSLGSLASKVNSMTDRLDREYEKDVKEILDFFKEQKENVFSYQYCDIDENFIGFVSHYKHISKIIPENFTVIDFGCAYGAQSYYFRNHKSYIGVDSDIDVNAVFKCENSTFFRADMDSWLREHLSSIDIDRTFAICNYVPADTDFIRSVFKNLCIYYPSGDNSELGG